MKQTVQFLLLAVIVGLSFAAQAQTKRQWVKKGDDAYAINAFNTAITAYEEAMKKGANDEPDAVGRLADSYRHLNRLEEAGRNYAVAVKLKNVPPAFILQYAHTLKGLGSYDEARRWYQEYARTNAVEGNHYAEGCDFAKAQRGVASAYSVTNELIRLYLETEWYLHLLVWICNNQAATGTAEFTTDCMFLLSVVPAALIRRFSSRAMCAVPIAKAH